MRDPKPILSYLLAVFLAIAAVAVAVWLHDLLVPLIADEILLLLLFVIGGAATVWLSLQRRRITERLEARERQAAAIVELGQHALGGDALDTLLEETVGWVAKALNVEYSQVLELLPDGRNLRLRAGVGWRSGLVGTEIVAAEPDSHAGFTLQAKQPVMIEDLPLEARFKGAPMLHEHGVRSGLSVIIRHAGRPFGVLAVHSQKRRVFTEEDAHFLQATANLLSATIGRKEYEQQLQSRLTQLRHIYRISDAVARARDLEAIYEVAMDALQEMIGIKRVSMVLFEADGSGRFVAWRGLSDEYRREFLQAGYVPFAIQTDSPTPRLIEDVTEEPVLQPFLSLLEREKIGALALIPLFGQGRHFGRFALYHDAPHKFGDEEIRLAVTIASHVAFAVQRRATEAQLRASEAAGRSILDSLGSHIAVLDSHGTITAVNQAWEQFARANGYRGPGWIGRNYLEDCCTNDPTPGASASREGIQAILEQRREQFAIEYPCHSPDEQRWFLLQATPLLSGGGAVISHTDITTRRLTEEANRQLSDHVRMLLESAGEGVYGVDLDGRCTFVNHAAATMLGYETDELLGRDMHAALHHTRADGTPYTGLDCPIHRSYLLSQGCRVDDEVFWRRDGTAFPVEYSSRPIIEAGVPRGAVVVFTDISERKRAEAERTQLLERERLARAEAESAQLKAQQANRAKDEFLAIVSHELRTPLNSILGWNSLLRTGQLDDETYQHALTAIENSARTQSQLVNDLLDVSRIVNGKLHIESQKFELRTIVEAALETERPAAADKEIVITTDFGVVPPVRADPVRVRQILWNLLSNAIKFTPAGGTITVILSHTATHTQLRIRDSGRGIAPEFLPYIFDRFRQADSTATRQFGGLGLGLAIVRHLAEAQGGTVYVESEGENRGSTFTVELPLATED